MKEVDFSEVKVGSEFELLGIKYIKKSKTTAGLKNDIKCWDYFSKTDKIKIASKDSK